LGTFQEDKIGLRKKDAGVRKGPTGGGTQSQLRTNHFREGRKKRGFDVRWGKKKARKRKKKEPV